MPSSSPWNPSSWSTKRRLAPDRLHSQPTPSCTGHACVPGTASQHNHLGTLINSKSTPALFLALLSLLTPGLARAQGESSLVLVPYVPAEVRAALPIPAQVLIYNPHQDRDPVHLEHLAVTVGRDMIGELFLDHELPGGREYGEIQALLERLPAELTELHRARRYFARDAEPAFVGPQVLTRWGELARRVRALGAGTSSRTVDLANPPAGNGTITAGSTWHFQMWLRDPNGGGAGFTFTDGLALTFQ